MSDGTIYTKWGLRAAGCLAFFGKTVLCDFLFLFFVFLLLRERSPETLLNLFLVGNLYVVDARVLYDLSPGGLLLLMPTGCEYSVLFRHGVLLEAELLKRISPSAIIIW